MAFVDEIRIHIKAGKGGDGVVRWLREKGKPLGGPAGGNGGKGGDVYVVGIRNIDGLSRYRHVKELSAVNGEDGGSFSRQGKYADDLVIEVPLGSLVRNEDTGREVELLEEGKKEIILHGGKGGWGNEFFKSSVNRSPKESTLGEMGEEGDFYIELRLIADAGLIGLPNAGKSSLLNALTRAHAKVANYQFTTLEPNLGEMYGFILADIPGLIEGASEGKGLGHKFLRHISRTKILLHCISLESEDIERDYKTIRKELEKFSGDLLKKEEIIILTKTDMVSGEIQSEKVKLAKKLNSNILTATVLDDSSIKDLSENIVKILKK